ncbi:hypothetical protein N7G274_004703 [Stereocaulon virgatum]|uniref:Large ribosomal subunit protein bL32m n=1 Tax=Stereocaulon virgatum TaxID=373712 RepID=A0ABR4A8W6_9LECA
MALCQLLSPLRVPAAAGSATITHPLQAATAPQLLQQMISPHLHTPVAIPFALPLRVPSILAGLWESILRAVPKKKTSHRKKRQRFLVGKALQDVTALNKCSACGNVKRAHLLCPFCVQQIRGMWKSQARKALGRYWGTGGEGITS